MPNSGFQRRQKKHGLKLRKQRCLLSFRLANLTAGEAAATAASFLSFSFSEGKRIIESGFLVSRTTAFWASGPEQHPHGVISALGRVH
jgi:hypothetical protein